MGGILILLLSVPFAIIGFVCGLIRFGFMLGYGAFNAVNGS